MNEQKRAQYLKALNIPQWKLRKDIAHVQQEATAIEVDEPVENTIAESAPSEYQAPNPTSPAIETTHTESTPDKPQAASDEVQTNQPSKEIKPPQAIPEPVPEIVKGKSESSQDLQLNFTGSNTADCLLLGAVAVVEDDDLAFSEEELPFRPAFRKPSKRKFLGMPSLTNA